MPPGKKPIVNYKELFLDLNILRAQLVAVKSTLATSSPGASAAAVSLDKALNTIVEILDKMITKLSIYD